MHAVTERYTSILLAPEETTAIFKEMPHFLHELAEMGFERAEWAKYPYLDRLTDAIWDQAKIADLATKTLLSNHAQEG